MLKDFELKSGKGFGQMLSRLRVHAWASLGEIKTTRQRLNVKGQTSRLGLSNLLDLFFLSPPFLL